MKNVVQAQMLLLVYRKESEVMETFADFKTLYKRAALKTAQRLLGSGDTHMMQRINDAWDTLSKYFKTHEKLNMPANAVIDQPEKVTSINPLHFAGVPSFKSRETLINECFKIHDAKTLFDLANKANRTTYIESLNLQVDYIQGINGSYEFTDISGAFNPKAECLSFEVRNSSCLIDNATHQQFRDAMCSSTLANWLQSQVGSDDIEKVVAWLHTLSGFKEYGILYLENETTRFMVRKRVIKGSKVFSPFALDRIKPVKELPAKPNRTHVMRMLVNGQFRNLKQAYEYNPDFGSPNSITAETGYDVNPFNYVKDLFYGNGYLNFGNDGHVTISEHSNSWSYVTLCLSNRYPAVDIERSEIAGLI